MITKDVERRGIARLLSYLDSRDISDLTMTVTNRMIQNFRQEECIPLILNYSPDALNFLKKKKVKKELIFRYLNDEQVYPKPNSTKPNLVRECLRYWGSSDNYESMEIDQDEESEDDTVITFKTEPKEVVNEERNFAVDNKRILQQELLDRQMAIELDSQLNSQLNQKTNEQTTQMTSQMANLVNQKTNLMNQWSQSGETNSHIDQTDNQMMQLAIKFGEWFYSQLPQIETNFNIENFWPESQMRMIFECNSTTVQLTGSGNLQVVELLREMNKSQLSFRPNLLPQFDGVRAQLEQHGLLKVMIRGILYFENQPVGWFDHVFGLIPDSSLEGHNWRIKCLDMLIKLHKPLLTIEQFISTQKKLTYF